MALTMKGAGIIRVLSLLGLFSLLMSCSQKVYINTIGDVKTKSLCVKKLKESENPLLDEFVKKKIEHIATLHGIDVLPNCTNTILFFDYGITPKQLYVPRIIYGSGETLTFVAYRFEKGKAVPEIYTVFPPPTTYYYTEKETIYTHWLVLKLIKDGKVAWLGEISLDDYVPDIRAHIVTLADRLFDFLGKDTGRTVEVDLK